MWKSFPLFEEKIYVKNSKFVYSFYITKFLYYYLLRMLTLSAGSEVGVIGLNEIFEDLYRDGKEPNTEIASEIVNILDSKSYIAPMSEGNIRMRY